MKQGHRIYISLGSNLGNRKQYLQRAVVAISLHLGEVEDVSAIYETPAWGFESTPFYNACISVKTTFSAEECLQKLLHIELQLGRERLSEVQGYQARTIDLDILFYDNQIIEKPLLIIPHKQISFRKFVLVPLADIASDFIHPVFNESIQNLLAKCEDISEISRIKETLFVPKPIDFHKKYNHIAIEGNIGAGKTTLATKISEDFSGKLLLERYVDNPFLQKFYEDNQRYGFALEMSFLTDRYTQVSEQLAQLELFKNFIISDYDIFKSLIFARVTLNEDEFALYRKIFYILYQEIRKPDLYVYLLQDSNRLLQNIEKRGRDYEKKIPKTYLDEIQKSYLDFLRNNSEINILFIDISDLEFVEKPEDYHYILSLINHQCLSINQ